MSRPAQQSPDAWAAGDVWSGVVATWCVLWLVVGVWTGYELWQLSDLGEAVAGSGRALDSAGSALESLGRVPVVGDTTAELGTEVRANGAQIVTGAADAGSALRRLAVLLGLTISVVPSVPVLALHAALRRRLLPAGQ